MISVSTIELLLQHFRSYNTTLPELILALLRNPLLNRHPFTREITSATVEILTALARNGSTQDGVLTWAHNRVKDEYHDAVNRLAQKQSGWHFGALHASAEQHEGFRIEDMALEIRTREPLLWDLVSFVISGESMLTSANNPEDLLPEAVVNEDDYWAALGDDAVPPQDPEHPDERPEDRRARLTKQRRRSLRVIRTVVVISIAMQTVNQQCNVLGAVNGLFFHACVTPDKVIKSLAHMGISISPYAINNAVKSLSEGSLEAIAELGESLTAAFAFDNFEIKLHTSTPSIDKPSQELVHLISGDVFALEHSVTPDDLRCSQKLWECSPDNENRTIIPPQHSFLDLLTLHPEPPHSSALSTRARFHAWKFVYDLVNHGPVYFRQFTLQVGKPEAIECIPVKKLVHRPARTMKFNNSTVDGNLDALRNLCTQGNLGDPNDKDVPGGKVNILEHVVLFHGDLGTLERVQSALKTRAIEATPWCRLQFVILVPGIFHFQMASLDGIWRTDIKAKAARGDNTLLQYIGMLRPKETGKFCSNPTFRQMHEAVLHIGIVLRLDAWCVEASRCAQKNMMLEGWAAEAKPSLDDTWNMAYTLALNYVAGEEGGARVSELRYNSLDARDQQRENILLLHEQLLLYEELYWAINEGDIGRLEMVIPYWIAIFKATGKHKYAHQMTMFLLNVHFVYPERLWHAIHYNMLVNPSGKPHAFRGVDWVEEFNNLLTKDTYGGEGSNYTVNRIITESPNILVYRNCIANAERNYVLNGLTTAHGKPNMSTTFNALASRMATELHPNEVMQGRKSGYTVQDTISNGVDAMVMSIGDGDVDETMDDGEGGVEQNITVHDLMTSEM